MLLELGSLVVTRAWITGSRWGSRALPPVLQDPQGELGEDSGAFALELLPPAGGGAAAGRLRSSGAELEEDPRAFVLELLLPAGGGAAAGSRCWQAYDVQVFGEIINIIYWLTFIDNLINKSWVLSSGLRHADAKTLEACPRVMFKKSVLSRRVH